MSWLVFSYFCIMALCLEAYIIDPFFWKKGKSDKPFSTILYILIVGLLSLIFYFFNTPFVMCVIWGFCARAWFDPILNHSLDYHICYHPDKNAYERFWRRFPCWLEMSIRAVWFLAGLVIFMVWIK